MNGAFQDRRGMILPLVLIFLCLLGIMVLSYSQSASHTQYLSFRSEQEEIAKRILESAVDEAFYLFDGEIGNPKSQFAVWLADKDNVQTFEMDLTRLPCTKAIVDGLHQDGIIKVSSLEVQISKRREDFRDRRVQGSTVVSYYGKEGHGTAVFKGNLQISRGNKPMGAFHLEVHHDYKVLCLVSGQKNPGRTAAQNRGLDYVLFVREGYREFVDTQGKMLNNDSLQLKISPKGKGKICFGGADDPARVVFSNIAPPTKDLLPPADSSQRTVTRAETDKLAEKVIQADKRVEDKLAEFLTMGDLGSFSGSDPLSLLQDMVSKMNIFLQCIILPMNTGPSEVEKYAYDALFDDTTNLATPFDNIERGVTLLDSGDQPHQILEGHVRQRYVYLVEGPNLGKLANLIKENIDSSFDIPNFFLSLTEKCYEKVCRKRGKEPNKILSAIYQFLEALSPTPLKSQVCKVDDELPYGSKQDGDRGKALANAGIPLDYTPFGFLNLRSYSAPTSADLTSLGFLENGVLKMRGAVHVRTPLTLGETGALRVEGQGVLSSGGDITIKGGITCAADSMLVLIAKGNIIIETTEKIEAGVVAKSMVISAGKTLNLKGSLFLDRLGSVGWPVGAHALEYDPERFSRESEDAYSVTISPRTTFLRMTGGEP